MGREKFRQTIIEEAALHGIEVSPETLDAICVHYELLRKWNPRIRLVGTVDPERAAVELFADSLIACEFARALGSEENTGKTQKALEVIDIGSGAGFPGVPVKAQAPAWALTLVETDTKRVAFLKELVRELGWDDVRILSERAETLAHEPEFRESFDLAFCRAVAAPRIACELAIPFLRIGGSFILQTTEKIFAAEAEEIRGAALSLSANVVQTTGYTLSSACEQRLLVQIEKTGETPEEFPRDFRTIKKKPLA
jgi:16S rRNA (guanine527-N7)-methyltransferase